MPEPERRLPPPDCREPLLRLAGRLLGSREAAEDVVQEALLRYVERSAPAPDAPHAWLARVTGNLAVDRLRRLRLERATRLLGLDVGPGDGAVAPSPEHELERRERCREAIRALLEGSAPRDVATALLREVFGTDYADLARVGGRSPAACRQAVHRALDRARDRAHDRAPDRNREAPAARDRVVSGARADAVLDRFAHAVLEADPRPLFDALRVAASDPEAGVRALARPAPAVARLRVDVDAAGARVSLVLGGVTLCTVPRASRRRAGSIAASAGE